MYTNLINMMAENPLGKYIENGLIFHLDGINTGTNAGYWTDLVGGIKFEIGSDVQRISNGFVYPASGGNNVKMRGDIQIRHIATDDTYTIEIVFAMGKTGINYVFFGGMSVDGVNTDMLLVVSPTMTIRTSRNSRYNTPYDTNIATYSANHYYCVKNLNDVEQIVTDYWGGGSIPATIAPYYNASRQFAGTICDIRVYNRVLTKEEMRANQQIDIIRYGIVV